MIITTLLMTLAILVVWHRSVWLAAAFLLVFGLIDGSFLSATLNKFTHGGWFPIALSGVPAPLLLPGVRSCMHAPHWVAAPCLP